MITKIEKTTLRERVLSSLKEAILEGELTPGTHLSEVALAEGLDVSRGTVREALRALQQARLVEDAPRGLQVRVMPQQEIRDLYSTRAALESLAITTIMAREDADDIIDDLAQYLPPREVGTLSFSELFEKDLAFHQQLVHASENQVLIRLWMGLQEQMRTAILRDKPQQVQNIMTRTQHEPILDCMRGKNADQAAAHLFEHMHKAAYMLTSDTIE